MNEGDGREEGEEVRTGEDREYYAHNFLFTCTPADSTIQGCRFFSKI